MITRIEFAPAHLGALQLQDAQSYFGPLLSDVHYGEELRAAGPAYSIMCDGRVIACAGVAEIWTGRGMAWSLLADGIGDAFVGLHRMVKRFLWRECGIRRIEAYVDRDFAAGHRWVRLLGFECEGTMRAFGQHGGDMAMYSRVI